MSCVKAIRFQFEPNSKLNELLVIFRDLTNFCLQKGLKNNVTSRFRLIKLVYEKSKKFGLHTHYVLNACEVACAILKNYRRYKKNKIPEVRKLFLKLDNQTYKIENGCLRIPFEPREFVYLKLRYGNYQKQFLENKTLKFGSVTVLTQDILLSVKKESNVIEPKSKVALDLNERNLTSINNDNNVKIYDLTEIQKTHHTYYLKRKNIQRKVKNRKLRKQLLEKYSGIEKRKVEWLLHNVSKRIVEDNPNSEIIMENLKGIRNFINKRKLKRNKYNGKIQAHRTKSKRLLRRLNSWNFRKLQKFIEYKALWNGDLVSYVNPRGTSSTCPICGNKSDPNGRLFECECGFKMNRDLLACYNILKMKGVWFSPDSVLMTRTTDERETQDVKFGLINLSTRT